MTTFGRHFVRMVLNRREETMGTRKANKINRKHLFCSKCFDDEGKVVDCGPLPPYHANDYPKCPVCGESVYMEVIEEEILRLEEDIEIDEESLKEMEEEIEHAREILKKLKDAVS